MDAELGKYSSKISGWGGYRILTTEDIENVYNSDDEEDIDDISDGDIWKGTQCENNPIKNDLYKIIFYSSEPNYSNYKFI